MNFLIKKRKIFFNFFLGVIFFSISIISSLSLHKNKLEYVIWSDAEGYYQYLTAVFIKKDVLNQPFSYILSDGNYFNKYTYGVSLMELPFFSTALIYNNISGQNIDGYSASFGFSILLASIVYTFLAFLLLYNYIKKYTSNINVFISLIVIYLGTNLFYYSVGESGMSHIYSFFLFSLFIFLTRRFYLKPSYLNSLFLWLSISIAILIRPVNGLFILWFILYEVNDIPSFKTKCRLLLKLKWKIMLIIPCILLIYLPQNLYWLCLTGKYWVYSYNYSWDNESFKYILSPKIFKVLFGLENGWFLYSPLVLLPIVGFFNLKKEHFYIKLSGLLILLFALYINSSWWKYTFGGALGYRSMVEFYPLLIISFALLIEKIRQKSLFIKISFFSILVFIIFVNLRITFLYNPPWDGENWTWLRLFDVIRKVFFIV